MGDEADYAEAAYWDNVAVKHDLEYELAYKREKRKMAFKKSFKKSGSPGKKAYTSVGLGLYDREDFMFGVIPLDRFSEYAAKFREAKEKGVDLVAFLRENKAKKGEKSPDYWLNIDLSKPKVESEPIEEDVEEDKDEF